MEFFLRLKDLLLNLGEDNRWRAMLDYVGTPTLYAILFAIIFAETGLVVTPVLPGDSLLFAVGAIGARGIGINLPLVTVLLMAAAVLGDAVNYWIGYRLGPAVFKREDSRLLNKKHLIKAQEFYEKYGGKTIILARFVPIVRTFAPFVAGLGRMHYARFLPYSIAGAVLWIGSLTYAGYHFGNIPIVRQNLSVVIIGIVVLSIMPGIIEYWRSRTRAA